MGANKIMKRDTAERAGKAERALKEKTAKRVAIERSSKERNSKERSSKERASKAAKYRVNYAAWTGWLNPSDGVLNKYWQNDSRGGFYLSAIGSSHSDRYEDRVFKVVRSRIPTTSDYNRGWTGYLNNLGGTFTYSCPTDMAVAGLYSYHDNRYEDRRWKVACNHFSQLGIRASGWPAGRQNMVTHMGRTLSRVVITQLWGSALHTTTTIKTVCGVSSVALSTTSVCRIMWYYSKE